MKKVLVTCLMLTGCGYRSRDSVFEGQVKYVEHVTPIICSDYTSVGISLGIMRNGTGSVSANDVLVYIPDKEVANDMAEAARLGMPVKVTYDEKRVSFCKPSMIVKKVEGGL